MLGAHFGLMTGVQALTSVFAHHDTVSVLIGQLVQGPLPRESLYLPFSHPVHWKPDVQYWQSCFVYPALHENEVLDVLPFTDEPAEIGQSKHLLKKEGNSDGSLYLPSSHAAHVGPS